MVQIDKLTTVPLCFRPNRPQTTSRRKVCVKIGVKLVLSAYWPGLKRTAGEGIYDGSELVLPDKKEEAYIVFLYLTTEESKEAGQLGREAWRTYADFVRAVPITLLHQNER